MRTSDFDYHLPPDFIAQTPIEPRDASRLLVLNRATGTVAHHVFRDLPDLLSPGDLLVLNQTRVLPARLHARKVPTGGRVELLLLKRLAPRRWEVLVGGKGLSPGRRLAVEGGPTAGIVEDLGGSRRVVEFCEPITPVLERVGEMPLPPYIHEPLRHPGRYQTVYAREPGSAAAPTAGLHFTPELLERLSRRGLELAWVTLHVGLDTFAPVVEDDPMEHTIHSEWCRLPPATADAVNAARRRGARVVAVGTTTARTLESAVQADGQLRPLEGPTHLYILPGYLFRAVSALITNFHLPRSTLLMMVCAFAGRERILEAYRIAMEHGYRFYSFGDAML
ncbi:MAG: tRNA preQ1(34) S-adenosylmethionine ribosyltransferase-isomerase QueA, partial [Chloroflexota bacterium]